ncbi:cytochrome c3 family protein [bacterium]|nr:cytochrome c3 family protein [bacterium]
MNALTKERARSRARRDRRFLFIAFVVILILQLALTAKTGESADKGVAPEKVHGIHLVPDFGMECANCHTGIAADSGVMTKPVSTAVCAECHDDAKSVGFVERKSERRDILFSHAAHMEVDLECSACHAGETPTAIKMPNHASCKDCHAEDLDKMLCRKCHIGMEPMGLKKLASFEHANDFLSRHPEYARKSAVSCAQCHTESYCLDCHSKKEDLKPSLKYPEKVRAGLIHRGDWQTTHRFEAKVDASDCMKCHGISECNSCHAQSGVGARGDKTHYKHPAGWMSEGSPNFHGKKARTEIVNCASCHDRGGPGDCRTCHRESLGLNPHPKNWDPGRMDRSDRMCAECHGR